jgi:hypothetical protein
MPDPGPRVSLPRPQVILRRREYVAQHYADYNTSSASPSSGNATAGHITQPSA